MVVALCLAAGCDGSAKPDASSASTADTAGLPGTNSTASPSTSANATGVDMPGSARPAPVHATDLADGVRRFGDGRALFASHDPARDRTVIATTIGIDVQTGDGEPTNLTTEMATAFATSADGDRVAAITTAGHIGVWSLDGGAPAQFDVDPDRFSALQFSGDAVIASNDTEVVTFEPGVAPHPLITAPVAATLGPVATDDVGNQYIPVLTDTPTLAVRRGAGPVEDVELGFEAGTRLTGVAPSPDGARLAVLYASPNSGDAVGIWDVAAGRFTGTVTLPNFITPDQVTFATATRLVLPNFDRVVAYDPSGAEVGSFSTDDAAVSKVVRSGDAAVISRLDGTASRWTIDSEPTELGARTVTLVDLRAGAAVTTVDQQGLVRAYDNEGREVRHLDRWAVGEARAVALAADGATMALTTSTGAVRIVDVHGENLADDVVLDRLQGDVSAVSIAPDDRSVATGVSVQLSVGAWDDTIELTTLPGATSAFTLGGQGENVTGCAFYEAHLAFSPDGALLASSSHDFTVQVTTVGDGGGAGGGGAATRILEPHVGTVLDIDFSPDGRTLITSADDGAVRMWNTDDWTIRNEFTTVAGGWFSMAYSPDGFVLAVSDVAGQISLVDPQTGEVERTFTGTRGTLGDMAFTPDGARLIAPEPNGAVGVWSVADGTIEHELVGHTMPVTGIAIAHDGHSVATASADGTVRYWPLA